MAIERVHIIFDVISIVSCVCVCAISFSSRLSRILIVNTQTVDAYIDEALNEISEKYDD